MTLARFVTAQDTVYPAVLAELRAGGKRTHWMWFVFPQLRGLGRSAVAERFGIAGLAEARAYLDDPVLGARLLECTKLVLGHAGQRSAHAIFGSPDDVKFRSSMTLFSRAAPGDDGAPFRAALAAFCDGEDARTVGLLGD